MTTFSCKDDVLTLLVHLGYLTYDSSSETVTIPNKEVSQEYVNAISTMNWKGVMDSVDASRKLLEALWAMDADAVAAGIDKAHEEVSILQYNDENSLWKNIFIIILGSCVFRVIWVYTIFAYFHTITSLYLLYIFSWRITSAAEILYFRHDYKTLQISQK